MRAREPGRVARPSVTRGRGERLTCGTLSSTVGITELPAGPKRETSVVTLAGPSTRLNSTIRRVQGLFHHKGTKNAKGKEQGSVRNRHLSHNPLPYLAFLLSQISHFGQNGRIGWQPV